MALYEVTLSGFKGATDETDHLIKWVQAPNFSVLGEWLRDNNWSYIAVELLSNHHQKDGKADYKIQESYNSTGS